MSKTYIGESMISKAGRGVFAAKDIKKNAIIEVCPLLLMSAEDFNHIASTMLKDYVYDYNGDGCMLALGNGSLYNHHIKPNAKYEIGEPEDAPGSQDVLYISALRSIARDEEIYINYGEAFDVKFGEEG